MAVKKITKAALTEWVGELVSKERVFGVQSKGDKFDFGPLTSAQDLRLDYDVTLQPPKKYFLPPVETLLTFEVSAGYESQYSDKPFVLIGVHPYDMIAINQIDELFKQGYYDTHYMTRRSNATIITCDVVNASENVFASQMKTATVKDGFDILLTDIGDSYIAEAATEKGEALLSKAETADASKDDLDKREKIQKDNEKNLSKHQLKCEVAELPGLLENAYNHPVWEEKAATCFACGSCNQVCPTCYCFNVQDDVKWDMKTGQRCRAWDGCMLDGFAMVAGGHDFRKKRADRFRHRLYRKAKYVPEKIGGQIACVGCGRCVSACLPDIANPVNVYNRLFDDIKTK
ncbi:MAG: 4Fe-4S dicluster domain-containing protein [Sedimentisphaerales bacterium]|nr:4Fe-4S dicluster domain-containing protein [Sedimentisphaerales bacterium]